MAVQHKYLEVYLLCFLTIIVSICAKEHVPVLIWGSSKTATQEPGTPALIKWKSDDFSDYILKKIHSYSEKPLIVVFFEENLSVEDFSWQDAEGQGSFPFLEGLTKKSSAVDFLPSVHSPLQAFQNLKNDGYKIKTVDLANESQVPTTAEADTVLIIKMDDAKSNDDRLNLLTRHDQIISNVYTRLLLDHPNMIAVYSGRYSSFNTDIEPSVQRVRRQAVSTEAPKIPVTTDAPNISDNKVVSGGAEKGQLWKDANSIIFLYIFKTFPQLEDANSTKIELKTVAGMPSVDFREKDTGNLMRFIVTFNENGRKVTLRFRFETRHAGYWTLPQVEYEENGKTTGTLFLTTAANIEFPKNFSYHCGEKMVFRNGTNVLTLSELQVQLYPPKGKFADSYDCAWFFTAPIWSGIFITFLLASIMTWGITMIMDIKTMDRFDDPKGKPITISANE